ncbi:MAG: efflux RND transporter periplasmic adaptor subunit [Caulobacteraceae bacterium]|nr:efflux RND transporter periplasmic adaptor subunit [Caulobacteraceae bacterium]
MPNSRLPKWPSRRVVPVLIGVGLLVVGGGVFLQRRIHGAATRTGALQQSLVVQPRPFASTISVVGAITPSDTIEVTAPFDGPVKQVGFDYGVPVRQGQLLVLFDTAQVRRQRDEAEAAYLKAAQAASDMATWETGPEVSRARRAQAQATFDLQDTERKAQETKALLDRGLVARSEYESVVQQQRSQQMALTAADQDLTTALRRGQGSNRQITAIELQTARARLAELDAQVANSVVRAPADGVIVRPPTEKGDSAGQIHAGLTMTQGQLIGEIAKAGGLAVAFHLGEADADRVSPGQAVTVTGPGFGGDVLQGHVVSVGGEALPGAAAGGPMAAFAATARLEDLTPAQAAAIRIGMTANVIIDVYRAPAALVVPAAAVQGAAPVATVMVKDAGSGRVRPVPVRLGQVAPDGVEVLSGLKAGDIVVWSAPPTDGQAPAS